MTDSLIGKKLICAETGKVFIGAIDGITTNYATNDKGQIFSDEGVDIREKRELLDRSKPFYAYVSSDGTRITGWKDNTLATVYQRWNIKLSRQSHTHDRNSYMFMRVRDVHGGLWYGKGSAGVCITLRPYK